MSFIRIWVWGSFLPNGFRDASMLIRSTFEWQRRRKSAAVLKKPQLFGLACYNGRNVGLSQWPQDSTAIQIMEGFCSQRPKTFHVEKSADKIFVQKNAKTDLNCNCKTLCIVSLFSASTKYAAIASRHLISVLCNLWLHSVPSSVVESFSLPQKQLYT